MHCSNTQLAVSAKTVSVSALAALALTACANLPYSPQTEASVAGAAAGALAGGVLAGEEDETLGAVLGALAGAGAGYVLSSETNWFTDDVPEDNDHHHHSSSDHSPSSFFDHLAYTRVHPATIASVYTDDDADLNGDGMVTTDELVAMAHSELSQDQIIARLNATDQVFFVTARQRQRLLAYGVGADVVAELEELNRASASAYASSSSY